MAMDGNKLLQFALEAGEIMLTSGAETARIEDTMNRILSAEKDSNPETIVYTTGLFASIHPPHKNSLTMVKRIRGRSNNLEKIARVNALSRDFVSGEVTLSQAISKLQGIRHLPSYPAPILIAAYGFGSAAYTPLFGGSAFDCVGTCLSGILLGILILFLERHNVSYFLSTLFGGMSLTIFVLCFYTMGIGDRYDSMIIGCLMPLVPGSTITNAIRDIMEGDFLCGASKVMEAIIVAVAIAGGVGVILRLYSYV